MEAHIVRVRYKLGTVLVQQGSGDDGQELLEKLQKGRGEMKGIVGDDDDSTEAYDDLVPHWAW
jgi:hypothetical protein